VWRRLTSRRAYYLGMEMAVLPDDEMRITNGPQYLPSSLLSFPPVLSSGRANLHADFVSRFSHQAPGSGDKCHEGHVNVALADPYASNVAFAATGAM
jgi:hypothetical protein